MPPISLIFEDIAHTQIDYFIGFLMVFVSYFPYVTVYLLHGEGRADGGGGLVLGGYRARVRRSGMKMA